MDPNENLKEQRWLAERILADGWTTINVLRLAELVQALDEWLTKGGFLPAEWAQNRAGV